MTTFNYKDHITLVLRDIPTRKLLPLLCLLYDQDKKCLPACFDDEDNSFWMGVYATFIREKTAQHNENYKTLFLSVLEEIATPMIHNLQCNVLFHAIKNEWTALIRFICTECMVGNVSNHIEHAIKHNKMESVLALVDCGCRESITPDIITYAIRCKSNLLSELLNICNYSVAENSEAYLKEAIECNHDAILQLLDTGVKVSGNVDSQPVIVKALQQHVSYEIFSKMILTLVTDEYENSNTQHILDACLMVTAHQGNVNSIDTLLELGASVTYNPNSRMNALHQAVRSGKPAALQSLLKFSSKDELNRTNIYGHSPLALTVGADGRQPGKAQLRMAEKLIAAGADINDCIETCIAVNAPSLLQQALYRTNNLSQRKLLHSAICSSHLTASKLETLLESSCGNEIKFRNSMGDTVLHTLAAHISNTKTIRDDEQEIIEVLNAKHDMRDRRNRTGKIPAQLCTVDWIYELLLPDNDSTKQLQQIKSVSVLCDMMKNRISIQ